MDEQGIMALGQGMQGPTAQPPGIDPAAEAAFEQARMQMDPKEVGDELFAAAEQVDPAAVQEFKAAIQSLQLPPEAIDAIGQMVDAILAEPENYPEIRAELLAEGVPADLLPVEFDAIFFGALNMALDQMSGMQEPMAVGPEGFSNGGIAQLSPIAAGLAQMGRNGDTMLAHITPSEARMLRRRGGSGTINPVTGLPEFFLKKVAKAVGGVFKGAAKAVGGVFKSIAGAVKKFASSKIGRIISAVALGFFLGPAAAKLLTVTSAAGVAAVSGFVGGFGSTVLGGGNLKDALKSGAIGAVGAGVGATAFGGAEALQAGSYTGPTTISGQFDSFKEGIASLGDKVSSIGTQPPAPISNANVYDPATGITTPPAGTTAQFMTPPPVGTEAGVGTQALAPPPAGTQAVAPPPSEVLGTGLKAPSSFNAPVTSVTTAPTATKGFTDYLSDAYTKAGDGNYLAAAGDVGKAFLGSPTRAIATGLGGLYLTGGFEPDVSERPGIVPTENGYDLLRQNPEIFATTPGGATSVYANVPGQNPFAGNIQAPTFTFRPPVYPSFSPQQPVYAANGGEIRRFADGGDASSQYQNISLVYDPQNKRYLIQNPEYTAATSSSLFGEGITAPSMSGFRKRIKGLIEKANQSQQSLPPQYIPFDPAMFSGGAPASGSSRGRYDFTPGGATTVPINTASLAVESPQRAFAKGGIAALAPRRYNAGGYAGGGTSEFPRRIGQIAGPGTEKSDSIPAMLSDGEFVVTAKAVRGAGNGSRREGAKRMYQMMHKLERMA